MSKVIGIIVVVVAAILLIWYVGKGKVETPVTTQTTTTTTETTVPSTSTSYVTPSSTSGSIVTAKVGQNIVFNGATGTVVNVVEDSRCPTDVQCIQAGTVRINVHLAYGALNQDATLGLNQTFVAGTHSITFVGVTPNKVSTKTILPADYTFTFLVK